MTHSTNPGFPIRKLPGQAFLWLAIAIFGASSSVTRKLTQIGAEHFMGGHNPISLCNVLFVGNLCALLVLLTLYWRQLTPTTLARITKREWVGLVMVAILAGALAPGLIFQALMTTGVNNVVLLGRLEPPFALVLSVLFLGEQVSLWEVCGAIVAFVGVTLTILLQPSTTTALMTVGGFHLGFGELLTTGGAIALAIATIISKKRLGRVPLSIYSIFRTALGTIIFFISALILYGPHHFRDAFSPFLWKWMLLYGAIIVVVGQSFWTTGLRTSTVSMASLVASFTPIVSILFAYLILGETPTQAQYIGGSIILGGVVLNQIGVRHKALGSTVISPHSMQHQVVENRLGFKGV